MAQVLEIFKGKMTYNVVNLTKTSKKLFNGFIVLLDANQNEVSYKVVSFRSHVITQSEVLGDKGMAGKTVTVHGTFKENTWNGETKWELMAEKIYIEGMEALAEQAEAKEAVLPAVPAGGLPPMGVQPTYQAPMPQPGNIQVPMPIAPVPNIVPPAMITPGAPMMNGPQPIAGGYVYRG